MGPLNNRDKLILVLVLGILIRILVMPHTQHPATGVKVDLLDEMLLLGYSPLLRGSGLGIAFYLFYAPVYIIFNFFQWMGISYNFVLYTLIKIPHLIGDIIVFYSLYEIIKIISNSKDRALSIATFYFLNPYVLFIGSWVGHPGQLQAGLVLLSVLFLIKGQSVKSGVFYSISIFTRYIPVVLFPVYIAYIWLNKDKKDLSLSRFVAGLILAGIPLSFPYINIFYKIYHYSPRLFISYFSHFFEASTEASAYTLNRGDFMFNFTGFITSIGLWDRLSFFFDIKMFLVVYFVLFFAVFWFVWRIKRKISMEELVAFPLVPYVLFLILIPLQQHHYLAWVLPFFYLASSFSIIPGYFVTILWICNLLIDPITGQDYKYAFGNTFSDPFPDKTRYFVNWSLQQSISTLMGITLVLSLCLYIIYVISVKNKNFFDLNSISKSNKFKETFFIALFVIYSITEIIRIVYKPILYTYTYSMLFGLFILLEFFGLGGKKGLTTLKLRKRNLMKFLNISSMLLILTIVSISLWDPTYSSLFIVFSIVGLWSLEEGLESKDSYITLSTIVDIFLFVSTTYMLLLFPNSLTIALYAIFLASWIVCQLGSVEICREIRDSKKNLCFLKKEL
jgi:hypothetical protein